MEIDAFLADSVVNAEGKLYVQGAGWNIINAQTTPVRHNRIGVGIIIRVPYTATNTPHRFELSLEDADGNRLPIGDAPPGVEAPDGKLWDLGAEFNVGRPPTIQPGEDQLVPLAINIDGLLFERADAYSFALKVDGEVVKRLVFRLQLVPGA